jgi:hypothetical protein
MGAVKLHRAAMLPPDADTLAAMPVAHAADSAVATPVVHVADLAVVPTLAAAAVDSAAAVVVTVVVAGANQRGAH